MRWMVCRSIPSVRLDLRFEPKPVSFRKGNDPGGKGSASPFGSPGTWNPTCVWDCPDQRSEIVPNQILLTGVGARTNRVQVWRESAPHSYPSRRGERSPLRIRAIRPNWKGVRPSVREIGPVADEDRSILARDPDPGQQNLARVSRSERTKPTLQLRRLPWFVHRGGGSLRLLDRRHRWLEPMPPVRLGGPHNPGNACWPKATPTISSSKPTRSKEG